MNFKAILFDFDGVIVDSESLNMRARQRLLAKRSISFSKEHYNEHYLGVNDRDFLNKLENHFGLSLTAEEKNEFISERAKLSMELVEQGVKIFPGVAALINEQASKLKLAIVSGSQRSEIEHVLKKFDWLECFFPIVSADDIQNGKPDPEGFLLACKKLQLAAQDCLVIEDSVKGVQAAKSAGCPCLAVTNSFSARQLNQADWIVSSLEQPLAQLFNKD